MSPWLDVLALGLDLGRSKRPHSRAFGVRKLACALDCGSLLPHPRNGQTPGRVWTRGESLLALCGEGVLAAIHPPEAIAGVDGDGAV
jgi:hypothetical protein